MKRIDLHRLQPKFSKLVKEYMSKHNLDQGQLAKFVGIGRNHLNPLINGNEKSRRLSAYYVNHFITRGVLKVTDLFDGHPESEREKEFWERAAIAENTSLIEKIAFLKKHNYDVEAQLDAVIKAFKKDDKS